MPRRRRTPPKEKLLPEKGALGQLGVNLIERVVTEMGSRWTPAGANEVGIDGYIELFEPGSRRKTGLHLSVQSKALTKLERDGEMITYRCRRIDVDYWLDQSPPVLVVVSAPRSDEAYWFSVQKVFGSPDHDGKLIVRLDPQANRFTVRSYDALLESARPPTRSVIRAPAQEAEALFSNLIPVRTFPQHVYITPALTSDPRYARQQLRGGVDRVTRCWVLHSNQLLTFHDPRGTIFEKIADVEATERHPSSVWSESAASDQRRLFVWLLNAALQEDLGGIGIVFFADDEVYAFKGTPETAPRKFHFQNVHRESDITVVAPYSWTSKKTGKIYPYLRHLAFKARFRRLGGVWYLEVTPTYRFTTDGFAKYMFHSKMLAGIKTYDGNKTLLSHLLLISEALTPRSLFGPKDRLLTFGAVVQFRAEFSVPDDDWSATAKPRSGDDEPSGTLPLFGQDVEGR